MNKNKWKWKWEFHRKPVEKMELGWAAESGAQNENEV